MGFFEYKGFGAGGQAVSGVVEAASESLAFERLSGDGITPILLQAAREVAGRSAPRQAEAAPPTGRRRGRINAQRRTQVMQELSTLLMAGVPLLEALNVMRGQETHPAMHGVLDDLVTMVQRGEPFSRALAGHPKLFPPLVVTMARVGETGGQLGEMLERMASWMEYQDGLRAEVRGALVYPCIVLALGAVSVTVLVTFVLPRIRPIFEGMQGNLPLPTKIMLGASDWMHHYWWAIPVALLIAFVAGRQTLKSGQGRRLVDRLILRLPVAGALILQSELARFASSCASLLTSGVPLLETLKVVRGLVGNSELAAMVERATEQVTHGQALARALGDSRWFPQTALHLLAVGEKSGRLPDMFERLAVRFEKATRRRLKTMIDMIAPLMIVFLAVLVGGIALSILLPIYRMNQMMH